MNTWHVILIAFALLAIGFASVFRHHLRFLSRKAFAVDYLNKFRSLVQTCDHDFDGKLFYWLTHRASKIQAELGQFGLADYRPPAAAYMFRNYQLIVNTLPEIRSGFANKYQIGVCEDSLVRYIGGLDDRLGDSLRELANPLIWLRSGVQCVLSLPAAVLCWLGVIGESSFASLSNSRAFKFVCGLGRSSRRSSPYSATCWVRRNWRMRYAAYWVGCRNTWLMLGHGPLHYAHGATVNSSGRIRDL